MEEPSSFRKRRRLDLPIQWKAQIGLIYGPTLPRMEGMHSVSPECSVVHARHLIILPLRSHRCSVCHRRKLLPPRSIISSFDSASPKFGLGKLPASEKLRDGNFAGPVGGVASPLPRHLLRFARAQG